MSSDGPIDSYQPPVGHDIVHHDVMTGARNGVDDLAVKAQAYTSADEARLAQKAIVVAAAATETMPVRVEGHSGHDDKVNQFYGHGAAALRAAQAVPVLNERPIVETVDWNRPHPVVIPVDFGQADRPIVLITPQGDVGDIDLLRKRGVHHDRPGVTECLAGDEVLAGLNGETVQGCRIELSKSGFDLVPQGLLGLQQCAILITHAPGLHVRHHDGEPARLIGFSEQSAGPTP